jgi:hypothetical protein
MSRKWFQIHLSTAIVLMITIGALLGANLAVIHGTNSDGAGQEWPIYWWGFPFPAYEEYYPDVSERWTVAFLNMPFNIALVTGIVFFCERRIRRREIKKP